MATNQTLTHKMPANRSLMLWCAALVITAVATLFANQPAVAASGPEPELKPEQTAETLEMAELEPATTQLSEQEAAAWRAQNRDADGKRPVDPTATSVDQSQPKTTPARDR